MKWKPKLSSKVDFKFFVRREVISEDKYMINVFDVAYYFNGFLFLSEYFAERRPPKVTPIEMLSVLV